MMCAERVKGCTDRVGNAPCHTSLTAYLAHYLKKRFYEVIEVIGEGSMGSVSKVRKRDIGGSARPDFVSKETQGFCFQLFSFCLPKSGRDKFVEHESSRTASLSSSSNPIQTTPNKQTNHKVLQHKASSLISYGGKKDVVYALKSLILNRVSTEDLMEELKNEVAIMRGLDHPHIVKAIETFDYRERLYLVLEICNGGDLYSRDPYTEQQACEIVRNLFSAISYLHSKNVVHRDLKASLSRNELIHCYSCWCAIVRNDKSRVVDFFYFY
jgi:serine/threonine protein kinase